MAQQAIAGGGIGAALAVQVKPLPLGLRQWPGISSPPLVYAHSEIRIDESVSGLNEIMQQRHGTAIHPAVGAEQDSRVFLPIVRPVDVRPQHCIVSHLYRHIPVYTDRTAHLEPLAVGLIKRNRG